MAGTEIAAGTLTSKAPVKLSRPHTTLDIAGMSFTDESGYRNESPQDT